jgi:mono/diheme cytochrome c family protein
MGGKTHKEKFMKIRFAAVILMASFSAMTWAEDGGALYKAKCAMCHGADGQGKPKMGAKLVGTAKTEDQIIQLLTKGGAEKGIHVKPIAGLSAEQAKAAATYVKSLK